MKFYIVGLDDGEEPAFGGEIRSLFASHTVFSGGRRHYQLVKDRLPSSCVWIDITVPLEDVFSQYEAYDEIVVFASGDPLFYGFANTVRKCLPEAEIKVYPRFHSLQVLAHRLVLPYQDMHMVSLTGRSWQEFDRALIEGREKIGVLTDRHHTPSVIARRMLEYGYDNYRMSVGAKLGNTEEKIGEFSLQEVAGKEFDFPNCLILERIAIRRRRFGIPESEFYVLNGRVKMITKMPVRLLTLSMLDLHNRKIFWDIGFCTGSVSIEARLQFPHLEITAFEQRNEGVALMEANTHKFGTPGITTVIGDFTQVDLSAYSAPDAVFIGGYNGKMEAMLSVLSASMQRGGILVFNSVSEESSQLFRQLGPQYGFPVTVSRRVAVDDYHPIEVIQAVLS